MEHYRLDGLAEVRRVESLERASSLHPGTWEIDVFLSSMIIGEKTEPEERPSFGHVFLWLIHDSYVILDSLVASPAIGLAGFRIHCIQLLE